MINKTNSLINIDLIIDKLNLEQGQSVADLGCGNFGFFVWPLAEKVGKKGTVYAVDILKHVLERINKKAQESNLPQVKTVWSNLEMFKATKIESNSLDAALLINTLHQSKKRTEMIREATRLLKRNGKLIIVEWTDEDTPLGPPKENRIKKITLKSSLPKLNLTLKEEIDVGPYHYGLLLTKL